MNPNNEEVAIVDRDNRLIGSAPRHEMRAKGLIHRATYILVFNRKGEIFVQERTTSKDIYPGYFDVATGGVMLTGESYRQSAARELAEEPGGNGGGVAAPLRLLPRGCRQQGLGPGLLLLP